VATEADDPWVDHPPIVAPDFPIPPGLANARFVLEPLTVAHNVADFGAWMSSVDHIRATPGFGGGTWPDAAMSPEDNRRDLAGHAEHFAHRVGFTYTVLDPASRDVIGCVYLYPSRTTDHDLDVRSWVRADRADLDKPLYDAVRQWLADDWPFDDPDYAPR